MEFGKFGSKDELMKAYGLLEKEFTKKCQELAAFKKSLAAGPQKNEGIKRLADTLKKVSENKQILAGGGNGMLGEAPDLKEFAGQAGTAGLPNEIFMQEAAKNSGLPEDNINLNNYQALCGDKPEICGEPDELSASNEIQNQNAFCGDYRACGKSNEPVISNETQNQNALLGDICNRGASNEPVVNNGTPNKNTLKPGTSKGGAAEIPGGDCQDVLPPQTSPNPEMPGSSGHWALDLSDEAALAAFMESNPKIADRIFEIYLMRYAARKTPKFIGGGGSMPAAPETRPKSIEEASRLSRRFFK